MKLDHIFYSASELYSDDKLCYAHRLTKEKEDFNNRTLAKFVLEPGNYTPDEGCIKLTPNGEFDVFTYPYMAVSYRVDSTVCRCDMSIAFTDGDGAHESWTEGYRPEMNCDMNLRSFVYDVRNTNFICFPKPGYESCTLIIKPFGGFGNKTERKFFFSVEYIAFFKTLEEAKAFNKAHYVEPIDLVGLSNTKKYRVSEYGKSYYGNTICNVFDGLDFKYNLCLVPHTFEFDTALGESASMIFTAKSGFYMTDQDVVAISQAGANFSFLKRNIVKLALRTSADELYVQVRADKVRSAFVKIDGEACSCGYTVYTFDLLALDEEMPEINVQTRNVTLAFCTHAGGNFKNEKEYTIDIRYIGFFENFDDAKGYVYESRDEKEYLASHTNAYIGGKLDVSFESYDDFKVADKYIQAAEAQKAKIVGSTNNYIESEYGKTYYVSSINGDDENDGLSPETAWKTCKHINSGELLEEYDYVLFERGSIFRESLSLKNGIVYSAYGEGDKPKFYGSIDASGKESWIATDAPNIWVFKDNIDGISDIGNIICNDGEAWGIKALVDAEWNRKWQGWCYNGFEGFYVEEEPFESYASLKHNMDFWHDHENGKLYLFFDKGNPGEYFGEIELAQKKSALGGSPQRTVIDNLCVKYFGVHGMSTGGIADVTLQFCEFGWIGGSIQAPAFGATGRLGNAIECFGSADNYVIHDCYAYQVYDCCFTVQWQGSQNRDVIMRDVRFYNNVAELSNTGLETWLASHALYTSNKYMFKNLELYNNYNMFLGYGWSHQRTNKNANFFYGDILISDTLYENCRIHNNTNVYSASNAFFARYSGKQGFRFYDNLYIMERDRDFAWTSATPSDGTGRLSSFRCDEEGIRLLNAHGCENGSTVYSVPSNCGVNEIASFLYEKEGEHTYGLGSRTQEYK